MLSESGRSVTVGTILRATEGDIPMIECEDENGHCPLDKFCRLRNVLARAREAFYAAVDSVTITELTAGASPVGPILLSSEWLLRRTRFPLFRRSSGGSAESLAD